MVSNEVEKVDFNALVARCAGSEDRKSQEEYLTRVIDKLMTKHFGRDIHPFESDVVQAIKEKCSADEGHAALKEPKGIVFMWRKRSLMILALICWRCGQKRLIS